MRSWSKRVCMKSQRKLWIRAHKKILKLLANQWSKLYKKKLARGLGNLALLIVLKSGSAFQKVLGDVDLSKNEVIDHGFLFFLADDMVVGGVLEEEAKVIERSELLSHEVVKDEVSKAMVDEAWQGESGMECILFEGSTIEDSLGTQVGWAIQEAPVVEDRLPKVGVMLLMDMLLKAALQVVLHDLQSSRDEKYAIESSLAGERLMMYGGNSSQVGVHACFLYEASVWILVVEDRCYAKLHERLVLGCTGTEIRLIMHVLWTHGFAQCHVFDPGGVCITVRRAYGFPFDPGGCYSQ
ncbi:hypothetical protein GOP47_0023076 [Adiantum capillus-veneris]|uniref:Uncharacterized protein n=1 Tax=Adiantum capillus-veneris TaxID=13818 RepID=A0A9D4U721_ADICA|nr:hypothetical protein GOP47_0023076 [Adiantum capillus-veneris]